MKKCTRCFETKPINAFHNHRRGVRGKNAQCKICVNKKNAVYKLAHKKEKAAYDRERRRKMPRELLQKKKHYRYNTLRGFIVGMYMNMRQRVLGKCPDNRAHYAGLPIMPKEEFYAFALASKTLRGLFANYVRRGHRKRFAPSIDRIKPELGYTLGNVAFVTHSKNVILKNTRRETNVGEVLEPLPAPPRHQAKLVADV